MIFLFLYSFLFLFPIPRNGGCGSRATCCAPDDFTDARRVAARIGIPYYVFDFEEKFQKEVIDKFVSSYSRDITPSPCVDCNRKVKFLELRTRAFGVGCSKVATGHYARIFEDGEGCHLLRGRSREKDQSYFLYGLTQGELRTTIFLVGELTKGEVRSLAKEAELVTAEKPESQDICFVSGSVRDFLVKLGQKRNEGNITDRYGRVLGKHNGIHGFTVGQRRGLGIGGSSEPLYGTALLPDENVVVVGPKEELCRTSFTVCDLNWVSPTPRVGSFDAVVQVRSRHEGTPCTVTVLEHGRSEVKFTGEWTTVSPGQAAVIYCTKNEEVLGGGRIEREAFAKIDYFVEFQSSRSCNH